MGESPVSAEDIRAAAEVHRELGPDYGDAVVESFLARIDEHYRLRWRRSSDGCPKVATLTAAKGCCIPDR
jgi:hypothetical protein